ncbi:ataxin-2 homolog [Penaeus chinensis]|uniref:ataxin-2 homolog n=1 Tax=Penaeus chinensis TaxID=139456 RepID=UPI001FB8060A|nr:ataxin-2 homolog [Penaeus chinensis]
MMKVVVVSLIALVASSVAAPHGFVLQRQDNTGAPFTWLSALKDAHARGSYLAPPVDIPRANVFVGPHRGFTLSSNKPLSQWLHGVVESAVARHNSLHKSLAFTPAVNRYYGSFVVPSRGFPQIPVVPPTIPITRTHSNPSVTTTSSVPTTSSPSTTTTTTPSVPTTTSRSTTTTTPALPSTTTLLPRSLEGDTDVNYVGPVPRDNPEAEVFDEELVREDARRNFADVSEEFGEVQPESSEVARSQPVDSERTDAPFL